MIIRITYDTGRIDLFDTLCFTAPQPFPGTNMLTNFELRIDGLDSTGLWLTAHYYDANASYREGMEDGEIPIAHRKKGWRFLLSQASEIPHVVGVDVDGTAVLRRAGGGLFDYGRFARCADAALGTQPTAMLPRILALYAFYERQHETLGMSTEPEDVASEFGFSARMIERIESEFQAGHEQCEIEED